jgi:hypothetical protein
MDRPKHLLPIIGSLLPLVTAIPAATAQAQSAPVGQASSTRILNDYIYGLAPVILRATRDIATAVPDQTTPGKAPINQFSYSTKLVTPQDQTVVRPNVDTLYTSAWLDLGAEPVILHVPDMGTRYYLVPMLDAYSNVFDSVGSRTTGNGAGNYAIVGPEWTGPVPQDVSGVIYAPTNTVWLLGRTLVRGQADLPGAVAASKQLLLIPLSAYAQYQQSGIYTPPAGVPVRPPNPNFSSNPLSSSPGFSGPEFFDFLLPYALHNPPPADQRREALAFVFDGFLEQSAMNASIPDQAVAESVKAEADATVSENGWSVDFNTGDYGTNYALRDGTALLGLGANIPADAVYLSARNEIGGTALSGVNNYVIHLAPGQAPPAHGFWSITVYDSQGHLIPNPIDRSDVGSETGLVPNPDGSLDIFLQGTQPSSLQSNWLPIPAGSFNLTLRVYWPDQSVLSGAWQPPAVTVANAPLP